jgi:hypothetical protein
MKRDLDLVRKILIAVEALPPYPDWEQLHIEGYEDDVVNAHLELMADADLVEVKDISTLAKREIAPLAVTWHGADFLAAIESETKWHKAKEYIATIGNAALPVIVTKVIEWAMTYKP